MFNRNVFTFCIILTSLLILPMHAVGSENYFPSVEINGKFYPYAVAIQMKGGKFQQVSKALYKINKGTNQFVVKSDGQGLAAVKASFFPTSILINFILQDTLSSAEAYINGSGPIDSIKTDSKGNAHGAVYIESSKEKQLIELKKQTDYAGGAFSTSSHVICKGQPVLLCEMLNLPPP